MKRPNFFCKTRSRFLYLVAVIMCLGNTAFGQTPPYPPMPALCSLPGTGNDGKSCTEPTSPPTDAENFVFVVAGDNRPDKWCNCQSEVPKKIFEDVHNLKPAFVLWTGDTIYGKIWNGSSDEEKRVKEEYKEFLSIAKTSGVAVFNAPGNHEMDSCKNTPLPEMFNLYTKYMGSPYGAFNYGHSRFIALNSEEPGACGSPDKSESKSKSIGYIGPKQVGILENDLRQNADKEHIFVFMHHPIRPAEKQDGLCNKGAMRRLFEKYRNVSYVFAGHEHMYYDPQKALPLPPRKGPYYLVSGGAGAPLKPLPGGFYHYLVFTVKGKDVTFDIVRVDITPTKQPCLKMVCEFAKPGNVHGK